MIHFNFSQFLYDKRKSLADLSKETNLSLPSLSYMNNRGTVKPSVLAKFETHFGDLTKYIKKNVPVKQHVYIGKYTKKKYFPKTKKL